MHAVVAPSSSAAAPPAPHSEAAEQPLAHDESDDNPGCCRVFHTRARFLLAALTLFCLASIWSNILSFNFALICFLEHPNDEAVNDTRPTNDAHTATQFSAHERSILTSAVAAGTLVSYFAVVALINRLGTRVIFTLCGFLSAFSTLLLPTAIYSGFAFTLACRFVQGIAFAVSMPTIGAYTSEYTYWKQSGLFVSMLVAYIQLSPTLTMPLSGALCSSSLKWPAVFYCHGALSMCLFAAFCAFYRNAPAKSPFIGPIETNKIETGKPAADKTTQQHVPYAAILTDVSVWAVWIAAIGNFLAVNLFFLYAPTYTSRVLRFPVAHSGFSSALPPLAQFLVKLSAGFTSDKLHCLGETAKLRAFNSCAFIGSALLLVALALWPVEQRPNMGLLIFGAAAGALGLTTGGFFKAAPLVSQHYSHFVTGNISLAIALTMLCVPFITNGIAPDNTAGQWRWVFVLIAAVLVVTNALFVLMCDSRPRPWTKESFSTGPATAMRQSTKSQQSNAA